MSQGQSNGFAGHLWVANAETSSDEEPSSADVGAGLASIGFLRAALRRGVKLCCIAAAIGLLAGLGYFVKRPPAHEATATVLLAPATYPQEILDDQIIAQSRTVAGAALRTLRLPL